MSQIFQYSKISTLPPISKIVPDIGPDVTPNVLGEISIIGGYNIQTDGSTPTALIINVSGTTDHAIQIGNATNSLSSLTLNDGEALIGSTGNDPVPTQFLGTASHITITPGVGTLTWDVGAQVTTGAFTDDHNTAVPIANVINLIGGNNIATSSVGATVSIDVNGCTQHAVQVGGAAGDLASIPVGTDGQVLLGDTGNNPAFATLTSTQSTIDFTTGAASLALDVNPSLQITTGFATWGGAGNYFDDTTLGDFTILRPGTGYINTEPIAWAAPQTVNGLVAGNSYYIYIDSTGTIGATTTLTHALYQDNIVLFECLRDSTLVNNQITVRENHPFSYPVTSSLYAHDVIGTVIENNNNGANITLNGTQKIQINGADVLADHGLETVIPDSVGAAVTFRKMYTNAGGKWATYTNTDTFTGHYNNAGTPTALGGTKFGVYRLYVCKDTITTTTPTYFAVLHTAQYNNLAAANTAIAAGLIAQSTNELQALELAQLGYIVYSEAAAAIVNVVIEKATLRQTVSTAGTSTASLVNTVTTNFDGILSAADTNVQAALETIDEFGKNLTDHCVVVGNGNGNPLGVIGAGTTGQLLVGATGADPAFGASAAADFSFTNAVAATPRSFSVENNDTDPGSYACVAVSTEPLGGDPYIFWEIDSATQYYSMGIDNSDNDKWKFTNNVNPSTGDAIITSTNAGVLTLFNDLDVSEGGTGVSTLTSHGVLLGNGAGDIQATAEGATGSGLMGNTGANPSWTGSPSFSGTVTAGTGLTATTGDVSISSGNLKLPMTSTTVGQIKMNNTLWAHSFETTYNVFLGFNAGNLTSTTGQAIYNTGVGNLALNALTTGNTNAAFGSEAGKAITTGTFNNCIGHGAGTAITQGTGNNFQGYTAGAGITTGINNTAVGMQAYAAGGSTSSSYNTAIGYQAGVNQASAGSSNIYVMHAGVNGESNKMRIGTQGSGNGQVDATYIAGIYNTAVGATAGVVLADSAHKIGGTAAMADGQLLIGKTGAAPVLTTLTAGSNITVTEGSGTITIASTASGGLTWSVATANTNMVADKGYITIHGTPATELEYTLPASCAVGKVLRIAGQTAGGWKVIQAANQYINFGSVATTTGAAGYLEFTNAGDCVEMVCIETDLGFRVISSVGNITVA